MSDETRARLISDYEAEIVDWRADVERLCVEQQTYDGPICPANATTARDIAEIERCIAENQRIVAMLRR